MSAPDPFAIQLHVPRFEEHAADYEFVKRRHATNASEPPRHPLWRWNAMRNSTCFSPTARAAPRCPIHMFVHGGYWRAQSKERYAFVADEVTAAGRHRRARRLYADPKSADGDSRSTRRAARRVGLSPMRPRSGGDATAISASGHSAGGHLASYLVARGPLETEAPPLVRSRCWSAGSTISRRSRGAFSRRRSI